MYICNFYMTYKSTSIGLHTVCNGMHAKSQWDLISSVESQKGIIADQRCSVESQKGAIAV